MLEDVQFEIVLPACRLATLGRELAAVEETMASQVGQQLTKVPEGDKFALAAAHIALVRLVAVQVHVLVELGRSFITDLADVAQVIATAQLVLRHRLLDGLLFKPTRVQVQMYGQVLLQTVAVLEAILAHVTLEGHLAHRGHEVPANIG